MARSILEWENELAGVKDITRQKLKEIADAIRTQDGTTALMYPIDMPNRILALPQGIVDPTASIVGPLTIADVLDRINKALLFKETGSFAGDYGVANEFASRILALQGKKPSRLPDGYTEVEYIEITYESSALPLTNRAIRSNSYFEGQFGATQIPTANRYLLNCLVSSTSYIQLVRLKSGNITGYCGYGSNSNFAGVSTTSPKFTFTFKLDLKTSSAKKVYVNSYSGTAVWSNTSYSTYLTIGQDVTSRKALIGGRVYHMQASCSTYIAGNANYPYFNWELVPCVRDDGRIGMYDLTNNTAFLASATYFSAGPEV